MFRTWYGNFHMLNYLNKLFKEDKLKPKMLKTEIRDLVKTCSEHVSDKLNNTPTISKKSYIDNKILDLIIKILINLLVLYQTLLKNNIHFYIK